MNPDDPNRGKPSRSAGREPGRPVQWKISGSLFIECRTCGFEPAEQSRFPRHACPKCRSDTWRRGLRPRQYATAS